VTGRSLAQPLAHPLLGARRPPDWGRALEVRGANLNNLRDLELRIPLGRLVCVTGVSGSGKSTLVRDVLQGSLKSLLAGEGARAGSQTSARLHGCRGLNGWEAISRVLEMDQTPIGKTPRSCPATYVGFWDEIRRLFAVLPEARLRGYGPSRFSFNIPGGRCEACEGQGFRRIEMSFLPDVEVPCEVCGGARFDPETRLIQLKGRNISEVLAMTVDEALGFFSVHPPVQRALGLLGEVGLGYLTLGQRSPTLSGGEAQRIKLVTELAKVGPLGARRRRGEAGGVLYLLDEPTIGLHRVDVERLLRVLQRLVEAGHSVLVIEHNLDVIAEADWVIDLGPESGEGGGRLVAEGTPEDLAAAEPSHTGAALRAQGMGR
jgi:excinuclease ABC subunit A